LERLDFFVVANSVGRKRVQPAGLCAERCRGQTRDSGAIAFRCFSARRKRGEHGVHGEGFMLPAASLTDRVIGRAIEVHRYTGSGPLESDQEQWLCYELGEVGIAFAAGRASQSL
jgi:hypothetical protein